MRDLPTPMSTAIGVALATAGHAYGGGSSAIGASTPSPSSTPLGRPAVPDVSTIVARCSRSRQA